MVSRKIYKLLYISRFVWFRCDIRALGEIGVSGGREKKQSAICNGATSLELNVLKFVGIEIPSEAKLLN